MTISLIDRATPVAHTTVNPAKTLQPSGWSEDWTTCAISALKGRPSASDSKEKEAVQEGIFGGELQRISEFGREVVTDPLLDLDLPNYLDLTRAGAEPISPLRERDTQALAALFDREDFEDIEIEVTQKLNCLYPEPCWEENPFEFLREYL